MFKIIDTRSGLSVNRKTYTLAAAMKVLVNVRARGRQADRASFQIRAA